MTWSLSFTGLCHLSVCRSGPLLLQLTPSSAAVAALPLGFLFCCFAALPVVVGSMSSSAEDVNVVTEIYIGTTDDEGWSQYGRTEQESRVIARKKAEVMKEEESSKEKDQEKEEEVIGKLSHMAIDPVPSEEPLPKALDAVPSKEPLPGSSSSCVDVADGDSKESFPSQMVDAPPSDPVHVDSFEAEPLPSSEQIRDHTGEADFEPESKGNEELMLQASAPQDKDVSMGDVKKTSLPSGRSVFGISQTLPASLAQLSPFIRDPSVFMSTAPDSDSNAPKCDPAPPGSLPRKSSLKRSQSRGRGSQQQHESRSRSRTSVDRREDEGRKPAVSTISGSALPGSHLGPMPNDITSPTLRRDFLKWTKASLDRDWKRDSRCWANLHIGLYLYDDCEFSITHPRSLAACAISSDASLEEPVVCWGCYQKGPGGENMKTLWPSVDKMLWHWYAKHAKPAHKSWTRLACRLRINKFELALELLGVDLSLWPLPVTEDGLRAIPRSLPACPGGHNPKIFGPPWSFPTSAVAVCPLTPTPPQGPPPAHLMNTGSASQSSAGHVDGSRGSLPALGSGGPIRPLPKSAPSANSGSSGSGGAPVIELCADLKPAKVHPNGSRFAAVAPGENVSTMGWHVPLARNHWNALADKEMKAFAAPYNTVRAYSDSRPIWYSRWTLPEPLRVWLLSLEEHAFYLFVYFALATLSMRTPNQFCSSDRTQLVARLHIYQKDLQDELGHFKAFARLSDESWVVAEAVLSHVKSVLNLRFPLELGYSFIRAPDWTIIPRGVSEAKVWFKMA